ncbi:hypothetical protein [Amycolatopsis pithecellobii]|uniref:Uncharacterized protein n=1 Tax=Amycolatopsis pithecellobii TaxID=664692 RepID=A0A6N7YT78_9PSEU|nr:hypothetical protein [Amycolatopsis pithecellobii]MTD55142.1 hypothetical protein [Amycolatopsis pithecellobii]
MMLATACMSSAPSPPPRPFLTAVLDTGATNTAQYGFQLADVTPAEISAVPPGQEALVWLGGYDNSTCTLSWSDAKVTALFAQFQLAKAPRTGAYFLADEPNSAGNCPSAPADLRARDRLVRSLDPDPRHFTLANIDDPAQFRAFAGSTDVIGTDPYPCLSGRACDWSLIPAYIEALRAAGVHRYVALLQAFGAGMYRWPTALELEHMIAQWQKSDWSGQLTFAWNYAGGRLTDHPDLLAVLQRLNTDPFFPFSPP